MSEAPSVHSDRGNVHLAFRLNTSDKKHAILSAIKEKGRKAYDRLYFMDNMYGDRNRIR